MTIPPGHSCETIRAAPLGRGQLVLSRMRGGSLYADEKVDSYWGESKMKGKTRDRIRQKWGCQEERKFSSSDSLFFLRQKKM